MVLMMLKVGNAVTVAETAATHGMHNQRRLDNLRVDLPLGESANLDLHLCSATGG